MKGSGERRSKFQVEENGDELVLQRRERSFFMVGCILALAIPMTAAGLLITREAIRGPNIAFGLFGLGLVSFGCCLICLAACALIGSEQLRIGPGGVEGRYRVVFELMRQRVPLEQVTGVSAFTTTPGRRSGISMHGLSVETLGRPIRFGVGDDAEDRPRLAGRIHGHLRRLSPDGHFTLRTDAAAVTPALVEVLRDDGPVPEPPWDSKIGLRHDWDHIEFMRKGTFAFASAAILTAFGLFLYPLLVVYVWQFAWKRTELLFMVPLILMTVVAVKLCVAWLVTLSAPFRKETWTIGLGVIAARTSILGIGRSCDLHPADIARLELRRAATRDAGDEDAETPYSLGFVGREGRDLLVVDALTEGEARWMGGRIRERFNGSWPTAEEGIRGRR
jgi:hypothetical protein